MLRAEIFQVQQQPASRFVIQVPVDQPGYLVGTPYLFIPIRHHSEREVFYYFVRPRQGVNQQFSLYHRFPRSRSTLSRVAMQARLSGKAEGQRGY